MPLLALDLPAAVVVARVNTLNNKELMAASDEECFVIVPSQSISTLYTTLRLWF
jgi:hypothetical protein